ncbi:PE-PPE domain-containing protein [Tsukamurella soli]|uniref:PE-PPE domain-containing protein n=1 Tax=Tsukamurella soli TaxID=644556 RepID=A0ABP8JQS0_9ACTN
MTTVFTVRGATEALTGNMLSGVVGQLDTANFSHVEIPYSASLSVYSLGADPFAPSGIDSVTEGVADLRSAVAALPAGATYAVLGYSLGAIVVTRWLAERGLDPHCLLVGCLANPARLSGNSHGAVSVGSGVCTHTQIGAPNPGDPGSDGTRVSGTRVVEIANPADVITSCPEDSIIRFLPGPLLSFSFTNPDEELRQLIESSLPQAEQLALAGGVAWWDALTQLPQAWNLIEGFFEGRHTTDYGLKLWKDAAGQAISGIDLLAKAVTDWA